MAWDYQDKEKVFDEIIERIYNGESIRVILKDHGMPSTRTFYNWVDSNPEYVKQYARACEVRADNIFEEILDISDNTSNDSIVTENGEIPNSEWINRSRLKVDARKWVVSKLHPKKYGEKLDIEANVKHEKPIFNGIDLDVS